jgi:hypothetical protein
MECDGREKMMLNRSGSGDEEVGLVGDVCYGFSTQVLRMIIFMTKDLVDMADIVSQVPFLQVPRSQKHDSVNSLDSCDRIQLLGQQ